jgi:type IV secretory pathway VirB2 component (pilin)
MTPQPRTTGWKSTDQEEQMRKALAAATAAVLAIGIAASPAAAGGPGHGYGSKIKSEFGAPYGQILNSVRGDTSTHGAVVFPPAAGAKEFYEIHTG